MIAVHNQLGKLDRKQPTKSQVSDALSVAVTIKLKTFWNGVGRAMQVKKNYNGVDPWNAREAMGQI